MIRDTACDSIIGMCERLSEEEVISTVVPCVMRLADNPYFTGKIAALNILTDIYEKTGEYKTTLRK
jgi:selenophosphate synthase